MSSRSIASLCFLFFLSIVARAEEKPLEQGFDYAPAMKKVAAQFKGRPGVVIHVGDSITYANPYTAWPRYGEGKTDADKAVLTWMHAGKDNDTDGLWLARTDLPGGHSYTACGGIRVDEMLAGGKSDMPPLAKILDKYKPQIVVLMLGTNDASAGRALADYKRDLTKAIDLILESGIIPIVSTIPPHIGKGDLAKSYNEAVRELAKQKQVPLIDFEKEILQRRPDDWDGTLLNKGDVHPTAGKDKINAGSAPTAENLKNSGYLLRGWLSVQKIGEVKRTAIDAADNAAPKQNKKPEGKEVKLSVTRDTWFSQAGKEADTNLGGASRLKLKSNMEMSLIDVDPKELKGHVINGATLYLRSSGEPHLKRVTVSSFAADWVEGTSESYAEQSGSSSFRHRQHPDVPWTIAGSDLVAVSCGQGGTTWRMADAFPPDAQGWQKIAVDPSVVAARSAGISYGFFLFDDTGSEWTRNGEKFSFNLFPNRFVASREAGAASAPYLIVFLGPKDDQPPAQPTDLKSEITDLPAGEAWVSWTTPADEGPAGTLGFFVTVDGKEVPRYLIPLAGKPGERVRMRLRDLSLKGGAKVEFAVKAVDAAGNVGAAATTTVTVSDHQPPALAGSKPKVDNVAGPLPKLGGAEVAILDELDKVHPVSGALVPSQAEDYLAANHLWNARNQEITLHAARNEFVAFQILLRGAVEGVRPELTFADGAKAAKVNIGRFGYIATPKGPMPDPVLPLTGAYSVPTAGEGIEGQKNGALLCELYVPHDAPIGTHEGTLTLKAGEAVLNLKVKLQVWDFTLPDYLSFLPEMNCYGLPGNEGDYYRLAHEHRTVLNRVPYSQGGHVHDGCAPKWDGDKFDWAEYDRRFGKYLDGSAFADLPRKGVPLECFYLPLHENWPTPIEGNYNETYWADHAFTPEYRKNFVRASRLFAEHAEEKGWHSTLFHFFLNGKHDFKKNGWSRGSSPWLLDEPACFQDYWALRYFGTAFHEGVKQSGTKAKMVFRADISRPQWQRNSLDGLLDFNVVSGGLRAYPRLVLDRKEAEGQVLIEYGGSNALTESNVQAAGWSVDSWGLGTDGVLPWQTIGTADSWKKADELALFYPKRPGTDGDAPIPSVRLKAYRRGQQDVEYLTLLTQVLKEPRWAVGQRVREELHLAGVRGASGVPGNEDAGVVRYTQLKPQDLWALRVRLGEALSKAKPEVKKQLIEFRPPARDLSHLAPGEVSVGERPETPER